MTLAEIYARIQGGESVVWTAGNRRYRGELRGGVLQVETYLAKHWRPLDPTETERALKQLHDSRACIIPPRLKPLERPTRVRQDETPIDRKEAQACLDVAFSVRAAALAGCHAPSMADITERPPKLLLGLVDPQTGMPDWRDPKDPGRFGLFMRERSQRPKVQSGTRLIALAVFEILDVCGWTDGEIEQLARMYPRRGPYATGRVYRDSTSRVPRLGIQAERCLVWFGLRRHQG